MKQEKRDLIDRLEERSGDAGRSMGTILIWGSAIRNMVLLIAFTLGTLSVVPIFMHGIRPLTGLLLILGVIGAALTACSPSTPAPTPLVIVVTATPTDTPVSPTPWVKNTPVSATATPTLRQWEERYGVTVIHASTPTPEPAVVKTSTGRVVRVYPTSTANVWPTPVVTVVTPLVVTTVPGRSRSAEPRSTPPPLSPTPTPAPDTHAHHALKEQALEYINDARVREGLNPVVLGSNPAAQIHAEAMQASCLSAHWGVDGTKPYMRYSLAGGYQANAENGSGFDYCIKHEDGYSRIEGRRAVQRVSLGLLESPGHRANILRPHWKKVNIGIALDTYNIWLYQHFEGDYIEFSVLPHFESGMLRMTGKSKNGALFRVGLEKKLYLHVYYDPPLPTLTRGQLARTYCYSYGRRIADVVAKPSHGSYAETAYWSEAGLCRDPSSIPADVEVAKESAARDQHP